jgi:hypothetical protein
MQFSFWPLKRPKSTRSTSIREAVESRISSNTLKFLLTNFASFFFKFAPDLNYADGRLNISDSSNAESETIAGGGLLCGKLA